MRSGVARWHDDAIPPPGILQRLEVGSTAHGKGRPGMPPIVCAHAPQPDTFAEDARPIRDGALGHAALKLAALAATQQQVWPRLAGGNVACRGNQGITRQLVGLRLIDFAAVEGECATGEPARAVQ